MQQRGLAGARRTHQRDEFARVDFDARVLQRDHVKLVAHVLLGQIASLDNDVAHDPLTFTRSPSFKSSGGLKIKSSPPIKPCSIRTPALPPARVTARPVSPPPPPPPPPLTTNTAPPRTAEEGITIAGFSSTFFSC